jgi:hypothetical protein
MSLRTVARCALSILLGLAVYAVLWHGILGESPAAGFAAAAVIAAALAAAPAWSRRRRLRRSGR